MKYAGVCLGSLLGETDEVCRSLLGETEDEDEHYARVEKVFA